MIIKEPGLYNIPAAVYHSDPCPAPSLSASVARTLLKKSPRHAWFNHPRLNPDFEQENKKVFDLPSAVHALFLERSGADIVIVEADSWRGKDAKDAREGAYAAGKIPLLTHEHEQSAAIVKAIDAQLPFHPEAAGAFREGKAEQTLVWQEAGVWLRIRTDWLTPPKVVWDLKVTGIDGPDAFQRHAFDMGYDLRVGFYRRGVRAVLGIDDPQYRFLMVEKNPPHAIFVTALTPASLMIADAKAHRAIELWRECLKTDCWPGYPNETCYVDPPAWEEAAWENQKQRYADPKEQLAQMMAWQAPL